MGEGFSARLADQSAAQRVRFVSGSIPGASVRTWYYLLREIDSQRDAFSVIVLPVEGYDDEDGPWDRDDNLNDARIVESALRMSDVVAFTWSFRRWDARWQAFREAMLKGMIYRNDVRDFLAHPEARVARVKASYAHVFEWSYDYNGRSEEFDPANQEIQSMINRSRSPQTGVYKHYRSYWLGKLMTPYTGRGTRFLIIRAPRNPLPIARYARYDPQSSIRSLVSRPNAIVADEHLFDDLEQPRYFYDPLHMNSAGRRAFSTRLADLVLQLAF